MSLVNSRLAALIRHPNTLFATWPRWLRPANGSSMLRWAEVMSHKPWDFFLGIGTVVLVVLAGLVAAIVLPVLLLTGGLTTAELGEMLRYAPASAKTVTAMIGSVSYELSAAVLVGVLWCVSTWLPSRRSIFLSPLVMLCVLALQVASPDTSLILAYSFALGWFMDDLIGCRPQLSKMAQGAVILFFVGLHAGLNVGLGQGLGRSVAVLVLALVSLLSTWFYFSEWSRKRLLDKSQAALRAQASAAERERIGRDLHDLLGHTLSLITLKLELSRKLAVSDPPRSRQEADEAETVARQALAQVRAAVTGMRATDLHGEIASAGLLLESSGVRWQAHNPPPLPQGVDALLSLVLREAVTNIARHAQATTARLQFVIAGDVLQMIISDDGRGIGSRRGNGLTGMRERVEAVDGVLSIDGASGPGTQLTISVPLGVVQELSA